MSEYYDYITGQGIIVPDTSVVLAEVQNMFKEAFGEDLDLSASTTQGRLIELFQRNRVFCIRICAMVSNMLNLNRATGFVLDDLGSLFLLSRHPATKTTTTVNLSGVAGTIIPAGTRLQTTDGNIFESVQQCTIGNSGSVSTEFQAQETGEIPCLANTLTIILDRINGFETANNPSAPILGQDLESDTEFRARIKESLNINSISILSAIKSNLMAINGVTDSYCYDNYTGSSITIDGITVPAHSILACVEGGSNQDVANVLYSKKTIGTGYITSATNLVTQTVIDEAYGTSYEVKFMRPINTPIQVSINVSRQNYSGADLDSAVKSAIMQWYNGEIDGVDGIKIGKAVSPFEISAAVSDVLPDIFIQTVLVGESGGVLSPTTLSFGAVHKATLNVSDITVAIVG